jgi:hypothetical protein
VAESGSQISYCACFVTVWLLSTRKIPLGVLEIVCMHVYMYIYMYVCMYIERIKINWDVDYAPGIKWRSIREFVRRLTSSQASKRASNNLFLRTIHGCYYQRKSDSEVQLGEIRISITEPGTITVATITTFSIRDWR